MRHQFIFSVLLVIIVTFLPGSLSAQGWTDDGAVVRLTTSTDKVGIGTNAPTQSLTLGNTTGANYFNIKDGTRELLIGVDNNNAGIISMMTNHDLIFRTGTNNEKLRITAGGNIGIGTTSPIAKVHIVPSTGSTTYGLRLDQGSTGHGILSYVNTTSSSQTVLAATSNVTGLYVKGDGKVGIGTATPAHPFHVSANNIGHAMRVEQMNSSGNGLSLYANTSSSGSYVLSATSNSGGGLYVTGDGKVGIGTAAPGSSLDISYPAGVDPLRITNLGTTKVLVNSAGLVGIGSVTGTLIYPLQVETDNSFGTAIKGRIAGPGAGGGYGVYGILGESDGPGPGYRAGVRGYAESNNAQLAIGVEGNAGFFDDGRNVGVSGFAGGEGEYNYGIYGDQNGWAEVNYAGYFDGDVYATGNYLPSDEKLKRNINRINGALDKVMSLSPKTYEYETDKYDLMSLPGGTRYGFLAQEFAQIFPQFTKKSVQPLDSPEDFKSGKRSGKTLEFAAVDYVSLIPVLTAAIQEQQAMIEQLVAALEANGITTNVNLPGKGKATPIDPGKDPGSGIVQTPAGNVNLTSLPSDYGLSQNFPNPFNPVTTIEYALPKEGNVKIEVYNSLGQRIRVLVDESQTAGYKTMTWDGKNDAGQQVASGTYVYRIAAGEYVKSAKMVLAK